MLSAVVGKRGQEEFYLDGELWDGVGRLIDRQVGTVRSELENQVL